MLVTKLEAMESIVDKNSSLSWEGWDVVLLKKTPSGWMKPEGVYSNGNWYLKTKFALSEMGWEIPDKLMR